MRLTNEQIAARRGGMGSTDVVSICMPVWEGDGPMKVYCEKRGIMMPTEPDEQTLERWEFGHVMEPVIARWYEQRAGVTLFPCGTTWSTEPGEEFLFCTHDYAIHGAGIRKGVEIKHRNAMMAFREGWDLEDPNGIPDHVRAQVTIQMRVCNYREVDVCAALGGHPPKVWTVQYDRKLSDMLVMEASQFWHQHVLAEVPPPVDGTSASRAYLLAMYPREEDPILLDATPEMNQIAVERMRAAQTEKQAERTKRVCDDRLLEIVAAHSGARGRVKGANWSFTWKTNASGNRVPRFTSREDDESKLRGHT
jgi:predicted phage-related endonuclease